MRRGCKKTAVCVSDQALHDFYSAFKSVNVGHRLLYYVHRKIKRQKLSIPRPAPTLMTQLNPLRYNVLHIVCNAPLRRQTTEKLLHRVQLVQEIADRPTNRTW